MVDERLKRIGVNIDKELWAEFRAFVKKERKRTHGVLASELEEAIKAYLLAHESFDPERYREKDHQDTLDRDPEKETHTPKKSEHKQDQPAETDPSVAALHPKYEPIVAELNEYDEVSRADMEKIITRNLKVTSDKARRDHMKTLEYYGVFNSHPEVGYKILTVNHDFKQF